MEDIVEITYKGDKYKVKVNDKFHRLTIQKLYKEKGKIYCDCLCECGRIKNHILLRSLFTGNTKSCGCYNSDLVIARNSACDNVVRKIDGVATRLYRIWIDM